MKTEIEAFKSGWIGIALGISEQEIDLLIERLESLRSGRIQHFHLRRDDFSGDPGIADIEISVMGKNSVHDLEIN